MLINQIRTVLEPIPASLERDICRPARRRRASLADDPVAALYFPS